MCKCGTRDPLVRMFLDRYKLNLLAVPRRDASCGQVYLRNGARVSSAVDITGLLDDAITLPPQLSGEPLADLSGTLSQGVSLQLGVRLLQGFLAAVGAGAVVSAITAGYEGSSASGLRFRFRQATRDSIEPGSLGGALEGRRLRASQPLVRDGNEYFVTTAVVRSPSIDVVAEDRRGRRLHFGTEMLAAAEGHAGLSLRAGAEGELTFEGSMPLAIALELYELRYDKARAGFSMLPQAPGDGVRAGRPARPAPVLIAPDDAALLVI